MKTLEGQQEAQEIMQAKPQQTDVKINNQRYTRVVHHNFPVTLELPGGCTGPFRRGPIRGLKMKNDTYILPVCTGYQVWQESYQP